ncbi:hypothetical protein B0I37DRAFT_10201 [Chaetomium sp. MPI-CAGE-AT-0009]|nr:hypothetical protein B0I37DRAFT_10201 [Chaetomium sp. MPI-CAGE-AT-0009]
MPTPNLHLRGGSFADASGYAPNFTRAVRSRRERTSHRTHGEVEEEQDQQARTQSPPQPPQPPSAAYEAIPRDPLYNRRARRLGIAESLLRPATPAGEAEALAAGRGWGAWLAGAAGAAAMGAATLGGALGAGGGGGMRMRMRRRGLAELTSGAWRPTRTRFEVRWPVGGEGAELGSEWFEMVYAHLFGRVREFAGRYFGLGDLPVAAAPGSGSVAGGEGRVWLEGGFEEQFLWFVAQVAMQDNNAGGWDVLLMKKVYRECLVTGVVGKVLEMAVFDDLLFGADKVQKDMLKAQDECTLDLEGYHRTALRSQCIRTLLADDILTPEFWPCVDQLTLQITTLLLPLLGIMDKHFPASQANSLRSVYQDLHAIVASAGYLSIGIRWSRNIFRFSLPYPGEVWDLDQEHVDDAIYKASEAANTQADSTAAEKWKAERRRRLDRQREREAQADNPTLRDRGEALLSSAWDQLNAVCRRLWCRDDAEDSGNADHVWHRPSRMGKVQIVLWPMLQRFETVGEIDPEVGAADGEQITTVFKSQVVYYYGQVDEAGGDSDHHPSLDDWMRQARRARALNSFQWLGWFLYPVVAWFLLGFLERYSPVVADIRQVVSHGAVEVSRYIGQKATLFGMEVLITLIAVVSGVAKLAMYMLHAAWDKLTLPLGPSLDYLWGALGGFVGDGGGAGGWYRPGLAYPDLSWTSIKDVARVFTERFTSRPAAV